MSKRTKARNPTDRVALALRLMRKGLPLDAAARRASVSEEQVRKALGIHRPLSKGGHQDYGDGAQRRHSQPTRKEQTTWATG